MSTIILEKDGLELTLCPPDLQEGYYRGTRFDHSGIFRRIVVDGYVLADEWFDVYDPYRHDAVCGTSEEFAECGYENAEAGDVFLKPGVGLLYKDDDSPYDHFKLYRVADPGRWTVTSEDDEAVFVHVLDGDAWGYIYEKRVRILDGGSFEISHRLCNTGAHAISGETYNHNFFTMGDSRPGPEIEFDFPFSPCGTWRSEYDSVKLSEHGIRYLRPLVQGESVFMGNLNPSDGSEITGEVFRISSSDGHGVTFFADQPFDHIVFWSNHRVGCIEPFIPYALESGEEFEWNYRFAIILSNEAFE